MKVSIVIPWYNTEFLAGKNLPVILAAAKNPKNKILEIIVVDDGSSDTSAETIKGRFPEIKLIRHRINRGFPASVNTGVRASKGDLICLLNSDVIPQVNFLESVFTHFRDSKVFAVSLNEDGDFSWAKGVFENGFINHSPGPKPVTPHRTFWVSGGSGVFRRKMWMELNGMDEKLFSPFYWEDLDLCYRASKRGYGLIWEPNAKVKHEHEASMQSLPPKFVQRIRERNQLIFIWKNLTSTRLMWRHVSGLSKRIMTHPGYLRIFFMALTKIGPVLKARAKEVKESKVSDEAIFARFS
jgi:GT2 family glycosyltransferase